MSTNFILPSVAACIPSAARRRSNSSRSSCQVAITTLAGESICSCRLLAPWAVVIPPSQSGSAAEMPAASLSASRLFPSPPSPASNVARPHSSQPLISHCTSGGLGFTRLATSSGLAALRRLWRSRNALATVCGSALSPLRLTMVLTASSSGSVWTGLAASTASLSARQAFMLSGSLLNQRAASTSWSLSSSSVIAFTSQLVVVVDITSVSDSGPAAIMASLAASQRGSPSCSRSRANSRAASMSTSSSGLSAA